MEFQGFLVVSSLLLALHVRCKVIGVSVSIEFLTVIRNHPETLTFGPPWNFWTTLKPLDLPVYPFLFSESDPPVVTTVTVKETIDRAERTNQKRLLSREQEP